MRFHLLLPLLLALLSPALRAQSPPGPSIPPQSAPAPSLAAQNVTAEAPRQLSIVRVNVTNQPYDFGKPWGKRNPYTRRAIGALIAGGRVLVTGELVANANYVEFEAPDGLRKVPAEVESVDYEANVAVLRTSDPEFLKPFAPLELTTATVGDTVSVLQLENNGNLLTTKGVMTTAEVVRYPQEDMFLIYRVTASLQARESSYTVPIVKDGKLVGLLSRYEAQSSNVDVIPTPVIEHFLRDVAQAPYKGFPRAGMSFAPTRDPQLRRYAGLNGKTTGGVYVTEVLPGGPADLAGLVPGDVILRVDGQTVDQDGNYTDSTYGKIALSHLLSVRHYTGDTVKFSVWRKEGPQELQITIAHRSPQDYVVDPYIIDHAPKFYILGGLVLQELSRQYLREWGPDWLKKAPEELVYFDREQNDLYKGAGRKIVFLSRVLPTDATIGYEELHHLVITKINGREILRLTDVPSALAKSTNGLHKIEFDSDPSVIYLNAAQIATSDVALTKSYRLPSLKRLE